MRPTPFEPRLDEIAMDGMKSIFNCPNYVYVSHTMEYKILLHTSHAVIDVKVGLISFTFFSPGNVA